jgi:tRNA-Thr(GGU) m(6)t(6)A37 methyltransferase TsaA
MNQPQNKSEKPIFSLHSIGAVRQKGDRVFIEIFPGYISGLQELDDFSHVQVFWWFDRFDDPESRKTLVFDKMPFEAPSLGIFASRAPMRPNPIGLSTVEVVSVDREAGRIFIKAIDAYDNTPVLDVKGYLPSYDRVRDVGVPEWAKGWPDWLPEGGIGLE